MPQPLSQVAPDAGVSIGNIGDRPFAQRPKLGLLAMDVIATWSHVESFMLSMYVELAGGANADAAAVYMALESGGPKSAAINALAERNLTPRLLALLRAIIRVAKSAQKDRDKLAHWLWGTSDQLTDALLLCDPRNLDADYSGIYVYREADFLQILAKFERIAGWGRSFHFILMEHPANQDNLLYDKLCREPEIVEILDRQARQG